MNPRAQTLTLNGGRRTGSDVSELTIRGDSAMLAAIADLATSIADVPGAQEMARAIAVRIGRGGADLERDRRLIGLLMPDSSTLSESSLLQIRRNAAAREDALAEFGAYTSAELAAARGSRTANPHTTTSRWLHDGRVFAVDSPAGRLFPAFQFVDGAPRPQVAAVLAALAGQLRGWEILLWFTGSNGHLDGSRPVDRLGDAPDDVVAAAVRQASLSRD